MGSGLDDLGGWVLAGQRAGGLAAVLFDMDGTLVDSEPVWGIGLHELARRYGGALSESARLAMIGTDSIQTMQIMIADLGRPELDPAEGAQWLDTRMVELFAQGLDWRPGAQQLLRAVRGAGLSTALVTNSQRRLVESALLTIGADNFDTVVSGDDVSRTKPHPEPYLAAAAALGVPPAACVAIEDSPAGIASASAAGCVVIAVAHHVPLTEAQLTEARATALASLAEASLALLTHLVDGRLGF